MKLFTHLALVAALLPAAAFAQTPTAFAERSEVIATGQEVHLYGLSTKDSDNKIRCFDVTMALEIGSTGKPADTATVASVACPKLKATEFVPGNYKDVGGNVACSLVAAPFAGRTQFDLYCTTSSGFQWTYTWWTGPITGSPIEPELKAAQLHTLPGQAEYAWGRVTRNTFGGCGPFGALVGARETSGRLTFSVYGNDKVLDCSDEYVKTTP